MFCPKCGQELSDSVRFCEKCGEPIIITNTESLKEMVMAPRPETGTVEEFENGPKPKKKHTLRTVLIIVGCVVVVCAVLIPILINAALNNRYEKACDLMDAGDVAQAKIAFMQLGTFKDAEDKAQLCQDDIDYNDATQKMNDGDYEEAKQAFAVLGSYENADDMAAECQNTMDYYDAVELKNSGDLEGARDIFIALDSFMDAEDLAQNCQNELDYNEAVVLMEAGQYEEAKQIFDELNELWDSITLSTECQNNMDYEVADNEYNNGEYYNAYLLFTSLSGFMDADDRALACIQANPDDAELYRNPDYSKKSCAVTIKVGDKGVSAYIKIYTEDNVLISTIFVNAGQKLKVKLPSGKYRIKIAYGTDWFGETDMYGDFGYYEVLIYEDGTDIWSLSSKYIYTLSLMQNEGGNLISSGVDREGF